MLGLSKALVFSTVVLGAWSSPQYHNQQPQSSNDNAIVNWEKFQALLDTIDPAALHSVLHSLSPKFQDGVFSRDRSAMEHVHSEDPIMASKLVHVAKKRQESNSTITTSSTTSQTTTTTTSDSQAASISSILSSEILASTVPGETTITVAPSAPASATAVGTTDGAVVFSTIGGGLVTLTSSGVGVRFSPSTSTHLFYETLNDGSVSTSTSVVVVNAPITGTADATGAAGAANSNGDPSLQDAGVSLKISGILMTLAGIGAGLILVQ